MPSSSPDPSYHLFRVRVRKGIFVRLQEVAAQETQLTGEYTTVSEIVRSAILDWIAGHEAGGAYASRMSFQPSGAALPAIDRGVDNDDADFDDDEE